MSRAGQATLAAGGTRLGQTVETGGSGGGGAELAAALAALAAAEADLVVAEADLAEAEAEVLASPFASVYPLSAASSTGDPHTLLSTPIVAAGNRSEACRAVLQTPGTIRIPNATDIGGAYVEWLMRDTKGNVVSVDQLDIMLVFAWLDAATGRLPVDTYIAIAVTAGGVAAIGNAGVVAGLRYAATGNEAFVHGNVGAGVGWTAALVAGAVDGLARGVALRTLMSSTNSSAFRQVIPLDSAGIRSSVSGSSPIAPSGNIYADGAFTHVALIFGHSGTTGAASKTVTASARSLIGPFEEQTDIEPRLDLPTLVPPTVLRRIVEIGDSNTNGTTVDGARGGVAIASGWTVWHNGAAETVYSAGSTPSCGKVPWLIEATIANGATTGTRWYARRGTNGADAQWPGTIAGQYAGAIADVATLTGAPDAVVWCLGANDGAIAGVAVNAHLKYYRNVKRLVRQAIYDFPAALQVLIKERTTATASYPGLETTIYDFIDDLRAEFPDRIIVINSSAAGTGALTAAMFDNIHWSTGSTGGQRTVAEAIVSQAAAFAL